jgi:hypothetical protein
MARRQRVDLRLDPGLVEWADAYARDRGVTRTVVVEEGLRSLRSIQPRRVSESAPVLDATSPEDGRGKVSRPVVPAVPGVVRASEVRSAGRCPSCGGRAFPMGGFQHKQTCPGYGRV